MVGVDAVHVLVQDGHLLLVVPAGRTATRRFLMDDAGSDFGLIDLRHTILENFFEDF